jgi:hypothetical protein
MERIAKTRSVSLVIELPLYFVRIRVLARREGITY